MEITVSDLHRITGWSRVFIYKMIKETGIQTFDHPKNKRKRLVNSQAFFKALIVSSQPKPRTFLNRAN